MGVPQLAVVRRDARTRSPTLTTVARYGRLGGVALTVHAAR
jgi:hypothetical protein